MKPELEPESAMEPGGEQDLATEPGLEEEPEKELEKEPGLLSVEPPWEPERWLEPEMQKVLEPEGKPELELDLVLPEKDWPEQKLVPGQANMPGPQLSSSLEHGKRLEPTTEGDQAPEMKTGTELWPNLESKRTLMGKPQPVPKREVQEPLRQQVPALGSRWSTEPGQKPEQAGGRRQGRRVELTPGQEARWRWSWEVETTLERRLEGTRG